MIIWKRSAPGDDLSKASAWLDSLTLSLSDPQQPRPLDHAWLFHSEEPDRWLWSLVVAKDRRSLERGVIRLELSDDQNRSFQTILALRFADKELADLIDAAAAATIGAGHQIKLKDLRERAESLAK